MTRNRAFQTALFCSMSLATGALSVEVVHAVEPFVVQEVPDTNSTNYGSNNSLAIDGNGDLHVSYWDQVNFRLHYARRTGGVWTSEIVDASTGRGDQSSITVDANGYAHIAYRNNTNDNLRYATNKTGSWVTEVAEATAGTGSWLAIDLDSLDNPWISHRDVFNGDLLVSHKSGTWSTQTAYSTGDVGLYTSIVIDDQGRVHVSHYDQSNNRLAYSVRNGGIWWTEVADNGPFVGLYTSIDLDPHGNPAISYFDSGNSRPKFASRSESFWNIQTIDFTGPGGQYTSLKIDDQGIPHVSYRARTGLKYSRRIDEFNWESFQVDEQASTSTSSTSLDLDAKGSPVISFYDTRRDLLKIADATMELLTPDGGENWPVGSLQTVRWRGRGLVDVLLSVDGGADYTTLASSISGGTNPSRGSFELRVPHTPTRFAKVRVVRSEIPTSIESDSLFTIQADIALLGLSVEAPEELPGNLIFWSTDPGPAELGGYRLEKGRIESGGGESWRTLVGSTKETSYHDEAGAPGDRYRLYGINGLGEEYYLGEAEAAGISGLGPGLHAWPQPYRSGSLNITFATASGLGGGSTDAEVAVYDIQGRWIRTIARGNYAPGVHFTAWDGRDSNGIAVAGGVYFIESRNGAYRETKKVVIVR